jgi:DNA primase large subunit
LTFSPHKEEKKTRQKKPIKQQTAVKLFAEHIDAPRNPAKDLLSHYALRLAYCRTDELRRWLLLHESELFRARFRALLPDERSAFVAGVGSSPSSSSSPSSRARLPVRPLSAAEFEAHRPRLAAVAEANAFGAEARRFAADVAAGAARSADFFAAPFEEVPDLVAGRRCLLVAGEAIVSKHDAGSIVSSAFRAGLSAGLAAAARAWGASSGAAGGGAPSSCGGGGRKEGGVAASEADRLAPVVESLSQRYLGLDWSASEAAKNAGDGIATAADVRKLDAARSLPLCMSSMLAGLDRDRHLKHKGRLQLGLFLKGAGLPLEEAMRFWRDGFGNLAGDDFDKRYAYGVRFNYGKEGKRADYTPYSCVKIVTTPVDSGDCAGCPYKTQSPDALADLLRSRLGLGAGAVAAAVARARQGHYQLACASAWEAVHGGKELDSGVNHPNQYFDAARRAAREEREKEGGGEGVKEGGEAAEAAGDAAVAIKKEPDAAPAAAAP